MMTLKVRQQKPNQVRNIDHKTFLPNYIEKAARSFSWIALARYICSECEPWIQDHKHIQPTHYMCKLTISTVILLFFCNSYCNNVIFLVFILICPSTMGHIMVSPPFVCKQFGFRLITLWIFTLGSSNLVCSCITIRDRTESEMGYFVLVLEMAAILNVRT
jgi:hypothetical protein